jgi:sugar lactone lactonase YvrE
VDRRRSTLYAALVAPLLLVLVGGPVEPVSARELPSEYVVSSEPGVHPEGIAVHHDGTMYVSSDATGRLYRGHVTDQSLTPFDAAGAATRGTSLGVHTSDDGRVWSVGADRLLVHDSSGRLLAERVAAGGPLGASRLNDLVLTPTAVYVTDWANPIVYRAQIRGGQLGQLEPWLDIRPAAPWFPAQYWLLNGIVADPSGEVLLVASNGTEAVWRVDTATKQVQALDVGDQSFGADGMAVKGDTLYAVLNYGAPEGVYVVDLDPEWRSGTVTHRLLEDGSGRPFDLPTTLAVSLCRIYVVNSQLDDPVGTPPFTVATLPDPECA